MQWFLATIVKLWCPVKIKKIERWNEKTSVEVNFFWPNWIKEIDSVLTINVISICVVNKCWTLFQFNVWGGWVTSRKSRNLTSLFVTSRFLFCLSRFVSFLKFKFVSLFYFDKTTIVWREGTLREKVQENWSNQHFQNKYEIYTYPFQYAMVFLLVIL